MIDDQRIRLERTYGASPEDVFALWTTEEGIEAWWAPDGFEVEVERLELRPGGTLLYTMTARAPEMVKFMTDSGMPICTRATKIFTEIEPPRRLAYDSLVDFVPGVEPYEHGTLIELEPEGDGVRVVETIEPLHDDKWTQRLIAGRQNELANLARLLEPGGS
jgi:uncharacterized protein YndB with AHSA1/START domain